MSLVLSTWAKPNGGKTSIMLEELGPPYEVRTVDIGRDQYFAPAFLETLAEQQDPPALVDEQAEGGPLAQPQMDAWSTRFHVVAVSLRHFYPERWNGKSDDFSVQQNAKDLTAFIESIGTPVYLVGWSYGGGPAYQTALAHPELVKKLVLDEGGLISGDDASANPSSINTKRSKETAVYFDAGDIEGGLSYAVDNINGPGVWGKLPEQVKTTVRDNAWTIVGIGMVAAPDIGCAEFASLKVPVLLVQGEFTTPRYKRALDEQAQCLSSARRVTIPKAGHSSARINPTFFNEAVGAFFDIP